MRKELARKVYDHLLRLPNGFYIPPKKDGTELLIFEKPFQVTDEEGELMLHFKAYGEQVDAIAKRAGLDKKKTLALLDSLTKKCWLYREGTREDSKYWLTSTPVEFWMPYMTSKETSQDLWSIFAPDPPEPGTLPPPAKKPGTGEQEELTPMRVVPREVSLTYNTEILPSEVVSYLIERAGDELAVAECLCRKTKELQGDPCKLGAPIEQCLFLPPFASAAVDAGVARKITKQEAYELMERAREHGLVHQTYSNAHPRVICSCCSCCCMAWVGAPFITPSNFYAQIDPKLCKGALECIKKCPVKAIRFDKKTNTAVADIEKCIGCGICVESCPNHAPALKKKERVIIYPQDEDGMGIIRARQGYGSKELLADYRKSE